MALSLNTHMYRWTKCHVYFLNYSRGCEQLLIKKGPVIMILSPASSNTTPDLLKKLFLLASTLSNCGVLISVRASRASGLWCTYQWSIYLQHTDTLDQRGGIVQSIRRIFKSNIFTHLLNCSISHGDSKSYTSTFNRWTHNEVHTVRTNADLKTCFVKL